MYGAILGDIIGSPFEFDRGSKTKDFELFSRGCGFTDDSVMTIAVGEALLAVGKDASVEEIETAVAANMQDWGERYPNAGYGGRFWHWLRTDQPKAYGSYGNGSAMRVSAAGWLYDSLERTREVARATANVTHNHPEGIKGAEATASAIYLARNGATKGQIKEYIENEFHYDLNRTLAEIRPTYYHNESCQRTVPEAIIAFLEADSFEDTVRNAVSLGGDTDTLGAIAGSIGEAFFGIPAVLIAECRARIDEGLMTDILDAFDEALGRGESSNWDEGLEENALIEGSIARLHEEVNEERVTEFMKIIVYRMLQEGMFVVPYITDVPVVDEEQLDQLQVGSTFSLQHDVRMKMETVTDDKGRQWLGVFTSAEEMHKGSSGNVQMCMGIRQVLEQALNWDKVEGLVINPFGCFVQLQKEMLADILRAYGDMNSNEER